MSVPAGLEVVYDLEKANARTPLDAFLISLHWGIIRAGLRLRRSEDSEELTERLPLNWSNRTTSPTENTTVNFSYYDSRNVKTRYDLKVIELSPNASIAVTLLRSGPAPAETSSSKTGEKRTSTATTFHLPNFVAMSAFEGNSVATQTVSQVYTNGQEFELKVWNELMEPLGLRIIGQPGTPGPYVDKSEKKETQRDTNSTGGGRSLADPRFYPGNNRPPPYYNPSGPIGGFGPL